MILSQVDLREALKAGEIAFTPKLDERQWGEASIDLRLGYQFTTFCPAPSVTVSVADGLKSIGSLGLWDTKTLKQKDELGDPEVYDLKPGKLVLALTHESISVPKI